MADKKKPKPADKKPAVKKPAVKKPAVKKPAVKKPAVKKVAVKKPAAKKPAAKKVAVKNILMNKLIINNPAAKKIAVKKPAAKKIVVKKPEKKLYGGAKLIAAGAVAGGLAGGVAGGVARKYMQDQGNNRRASLPSSDRSSEFSWGSFSGPSSSSSSGPGSFQDERNANKTRFDEKRIKDADTQTPNQILEKRIKDADTQTPNPFLERSNRDANIQTPNLFQEKRNGDGGVNVNIKINTDDKPMIINRKADTRRQVIVSDEGSPIVYNNKPARSVLTQTPITDRPVKTPFRLENPPRGIAQQLSDSVGSFIVRPRDAATQLNRSIGTNTDINQTRFEEREATIGGTFNPAPGFLGQFLNTIDSISRTPQTPATPATPATPTTQATPATQATSATPATPPPATPVTQATQATPATPPPAPQRPRASRTPQLRMRQRLREIRANIPLDQFRSQISLLNTPPITPTPAPQRPRATSATIQATQATQKQMMPPTSKPQSVIITPPTSDDRPPYLPNNRSRLSNSTPGPSTEFPPNKPNNDNNTEETAKQLFEEVITVAQEAPFDDTEENCLDLVSKAFEDYLRLDLNDILNNSDAFEQKYKALLTQAKGDKKQNIEKCKDIIKGKVVKEETSKQLLEEVITVAQEAPFEATEENCLGLVSKAFEDYLDLDLNDILNNSDAFEQKYKALLTQAKGDKKQNIEKCKDIIKGKVVKKVPEFQVKRKQSDGSDTTPGPSSEFPPNKPNNDNNTEETAKQLFEEAITVAQEAPFEATEENCLDLVSKAFEDNFKGMGLTLEFLINSGTLDDYYKLLLDKVIGADKDKVKECKSVIQTYAKSRQPKQVEIPLEFKDTNVITPVKMKTEEPADGLGKQLQDNAGAILASFGALVGAAAAPQDKPEIQLEDDTCDILLSKNAKNPIVLSNNIGLEYDKALRSYKNTPDMVNKQHRFYRKIIKCMAEKNPGKYYTEQDGSITFSSGLVARVDHLNCERYPDTKGCEIDCEKSPDDIKCALLGKDSGSLKKIGPGKYIKKY